MTRRAFVALFVLGVIGLWVYAAVAISRPLQIVVDYRAAIIDYEGRLYLPMRIGPFGRTKTAIYDSPLAWESQLIEWKGRTDIRVVEVYDREESK